MPENINSKMIEIARGVRGLTQKELSALLPFNQSNISKIENGELSVSPESIKVIATALNFPVDFFLQEEINTPISNIYFRKRSTIKQKTLDKIFSDIKVILKSIDNILESIELKEFKRYSFDICEGWTANSAAIRVREILRVPNGPIKNLVKYLEDEGIIVYFYDSMDEKFDGLTAYTNSGFPVIVVNKNMPNDRLRFTIAHELGHLVLHIPCDVEPWRDVENEANDFASEFLMPEQDCYSDLIKLSYSRLGMLKAFWGVSKAFIIRRTRSLALINEATYKYLMIELGRKNERKSESGYVDIDTPNILKDSINLIKDELSYTDEDLAVTVRLNINDYYNYFENDKKVLRFRPLKQVV